MAIPAFRIDVFVIFLIVFGLAAVLRSLRQRTFESFKFYWFMRCISNRTSGGGNGILMLDLAHSKSEFMVVDCCTV